MSRKTIALLPEDSGLDSRVVLVAENIAALRLQDESWAGGLPRASDGVRELYTRWYVMADYIGGGHTSIGLFQEEGPERSEAPKREAEAWLDTVQGLLEDVLAP